MRGPTFYQLHLLLDKHAGEQVTLIDAIAERVQTLGGVAVGDPRHVAEITCVSRPPNGAEELPAMLSRLLEVHETILIHAHEDAARAARSGDDGTNDLIVSAVIRASELQAWFLAEHFAAAAGLDPLLVGLLRIRTSQINGCAFCLRMHTRDALKKGENPDRIAVLPGWEETGYFSKTDRAALRLAEMVTRVPDGHVSDENYNAAAAALAPGQISAVTWLATVMNAFNRAAITSQYHVAA